MAISMSDKAYRLIAVGRIPASTRDSMGDSLGSLSGLALAPGSWRGAGGSYSGTLISLPDRGFNIPEKGRFSDYASRLHRIRFDLRDDKVELVLTNSSYLRDANGALMTGIDPQNHFVEQLGARVPSPKKGLGAGRLSMDCEGLAIASDGRIFVSDEFSCNILCCSPQGEVIGIIAPPDAFTPYVKSEICYSSRDGVRVKRGRMPNDGFEGLSLSPDGRLLFALLQSPLAQDREGPQKSWRYTRLLVYDVSGKELPRSPIAHYVVELPLYVDDHAAETLKAAEANEIVALGHDRILILARDGRGFGAKESNRDKQIAFKQVMLGSLKGATNLAKSKFERKPKSVAPDGDLDGSIEPIRLSPFLDIADEAELNRVRLSTKANRRGLQLLSAKWESLVLSPTLDASRPNERLLFVGNDNDFRTRNGVMPDGRYDGEIDHDSMILIYRITLPR